MHGRSSRRSSTERLSAGAGNAYPTWKEIVAVVPIEDVKLLEALEDKIDLDEAWAALAEAKKKGSVSWEKIKKELGI